MTLWAFANEFFQIVVTGNKQDQKQQLQEILESLEIELPGRSVLDFGCGTGLFLKVFLTFGLTYTGYDIDVSSIKYASSLRGSDRARFYDNFEAARGRGPFDLIFSNCCFHHIEDSVLTAELERIGAHLRKDGFFVMKDLLFNDDPVHPLCALYRKLERGAYKRTEVGYRTLVEKCFSVCGSRIQRTHLFSLPNIPVYNDTVVLICKKR